MLNIIIIINGSFYLIYKNTKTQMWFLKLENERLKSFDEQNLHNQSGDHLKAINPISENTESIILSKLDVFEKSKGLTDKNLSLKKMAWSHQECYLHRQSLLILQFRVILQRKTAFWNTGIGLMVSQLPEVEVGNIERGKEFKMTVKGRTNGIFQSTHL